MNGQDLLEAMSFLDEELVAASDAPARAFPWKRVVSLAACFCLLLLGTFTLFRFTLGEKSSESAADTFSLTEAAPQMDAGEAETAAGAAAENACAAEAPPILICLEELTETGFRATALEDGPDWNQGDSILMEYADGFLPDILISGTEYHVWVESFDPQTLRAIIFQIEPVS